MCKSFEHVKAGDSLLVKTHGILGHSYSIETVQRITKTLIVVRESLSFQKTTGEETRQRSSDIYRSNTICRLATDEDVKIIASNLKFSDDITIIALELNQIENQLRTIRDTSHFIYRDLKFSWSCPSIDDAASKVENLAKRIKALNELLPITQETD